MLQTFDLEVSQLIFVIISVKTLCSRQYDCVMLRYKPCLYISLRNSRLFFSVWQDGLMSVKLSAGDDTQGSAGSAASFSALQCWL